MENETTIIAPAIERLRRVFPCDEWEITLLKRLRQLRAQGVNQVLLGLAQPCILEKIDARREHLDVRPEPHGLTPPQTVIE